MDQHHFIESMPAKFGYVDAYSVLTPADSNVQLQTPRPDNDSVVPDIPYQELVGTLLYMQVSTQPDITHAVNKVSQFSSNFRQIHCTAVSRSAKYLRCTSDYSLCYDGTGQSTCADADFVGDLDEWLCFPFQRGPYHVVEQKAALDCYFYN